MPDRPEPVERDPLPASDPGIGVTRIMAAGAMLVLIVAVIWYVFGR